MEISQHIKNLLITNERVILGGFGSFDSKHIPARIDKETKTMTPPFKIVVFNPNIKEDAGLLAEYMAEKENISLESAKEQISEYVKTVKAKLDAGEKVVFKDLGEFKKTPDGKYEFAYLSEDNLLLDSFGLPKVSLAETEKTSEIPPKKDIRKEPIKKVPDKRKKSTVTPKPVKKTKTEKKKNIEDKKKKRRIPVFLIFIALIGILLAALYFFKPDLWNKGYNCSAEKLAYVKQKIFGNEDDLEIITPEDTVITAKEITEELKDTSEVNNENSDENVTEEDTAYAETTADNEPNEEAENTGETTNTTVENNEADTGTGIVSEPAQSGKYYIIIGSVKTEAAAQKEKKRFAAKGITADIIYVPHMDRYRISLGAFSSAKEAQDFFSDFSSKHGNIDAWVWEKR
ncbi:MAG: hypothetical protein GXO50_01125 [Chlorobi bacterium]|nr:hypothetical protein [Chlorobiota bacterium]